MHLLNSTEKRYVRNVVKPLFCTSVVLYTKWFDHGRAMENAHHPAENKTQEQQQVEPSSVRDLERRI
ncbi:hypothetical protein Y032_0093g2652 [Ancylostoma ceylanicum]|uniref:Uncharacterized protein n=1 Tax=Ancylostoma ceylanicum TaxID=53326 RepID=A0A016TLH8_9BILA|nr:hypothetical protein Y032_0093g2652 [Ancylostoma ceylanicum]